MFGRIGIQSGAFTPEAYEWTRNNYGMSALSVHERALSTLRAQAQVVPSLYLDVNPGTYRYGNTIVLFPGGVSPEFSPPVSGTRLDVLYLDCATGALAVEEGTAATAITDALELPDVPVGAIPLVAVHLAASQAAITEADLYDMRPFLAASGAAVQDYDAASATSTITTTSTSMVDMTNMSVSVTVVVDALVLIVAEFRQSGFNSESQYYTIDDGSSNLINELQAENESDNDVKPVTLYAHKAVSAGTHTFTVQWRVSDGTGRVIKRNMWAVALTR